MIQTQFMYDFDGRAPFDEPSGRSALGWGPFYRCYQAADGWFFLAAPSDGREALKSVAEFEDLLELSDPQLSEALADRFKSRPIAHWRNRLARGSTALAPLASLLETRDEALQIESAGEVDIAKASYRAVRNDSHPMGRYCDLAAPNAVRPTKGTIAIPGPAPKYGQHTEAILRRLGYGGEEIAAMLESGAAGTAWSEKYLPD